MKADDMTLKKGSFAIFGSPFLAVASFVSSLVLSSYTVYFSQLYSRCSLSHPLGDRSCGGIRTIQNRRNVGHTSEIYILGVTV